MVGGREAGARKYSDKIWEGKKLDNQFWATFSRRGRFEKVNFLLTVLKVPVATMIRRRGDAVLPVFYIHFFLRSALPMHLMGWAFFRSPSTRRMNGVLLEKVCQRSRFVGLECHYWRSISTVKLPNHVSRFATTQTSCHTLFFKRDTIQRQFLKISVFFPLCAEKTLWKSQGISLIWSPLKIK